MYLLKYLGTLGLYDPRDLYKLDGYLAPFASAVEANHSQLRHADVTPAWSPQAMFTTSCKAELHDAPNKHRCAHLHIYFLD